MLEHEFCGVTDITAESAEHGDSGGWGEKKSVGHIINDRVQECVLSGCKLLPAEINLMEQRIEEREKLQINTKEISSASCISV